MRSIALLGFCLLQWTAIVDATAADVYPAKALRLIVPFPPGGPADALARLVGDKLSASLGKAVVVDNRPGAGGNIGMELGARSAPDGYTLVLAPAGNLTVNPFLYRNVPYDVGRDFAPVTVIAAVPNVLVVHPSVPAKSVAELVRHAKAHPGTLNYSSPGNGSGAHLAGELFKSMTGVDIVHIPFNGIAPAVTAVVGGQVQIMFAGAPSALPQVKAGRLVALGVASPKRIAAAPDLPTLAESGLPGFDVTSWYSIVVPSGTPNDIIAKLRSEIASALTQPDIQEKLAGLGAEPIGNTPAEFAAMLKVETAKWGKIVKDANIQVE
ncbi:MAG: tripartite tricarboxylate transporter substrate binding protein [Betaproteobacteria bacterium]|nr:MAG: tripartite tricarboxylate transporter substrate binding protein [Betaproteobacteria bacterium]